MATFSRDELESFRDQTVPDLLGPDVRLLFVGINPGLWTAATGTHFAHPGNRFWPALWKAGILTEPVSASDGMDDADRERVLARGLGFTNLVRRATARADELSLAEIRAGGEELRATVERVRPTVMAMAGITSWRQAFKDRTAVTGEQSQRWGSTRIWVVPNPSGLNAHETVDSLARAYAEPARAAGIL